jgi:hypothetical protein
MVTFGSKKNIYCLLVVAEHFYAHYAALDSSVLVIGLLEKMRLI